MITCFPPIGGNRYINWSWIKRVLRVRRFARKMEKAGYRRHETDWEIVRGGRWEEIIVDAVVDIEGKSVWTKLGPRA